MLAGRVLLSLLALLILVGTALGEEPTKNNVSINTTPDLWLSNGIIGIDFHSWGSDNFQYPLGSNNLWYGGGIRFAIRYDGVFKWSHNGWLPSAPALSVVESMHLVDDTPEKKVAVGVVADANIEIKTEVTLLKDKKWVAVIYTIKNKANQSLSVKFYQGADFDVYHMSFWNDAGKYDPELNLLYQWDTRGHPYVGIASPLKPTKYDVTYWWSMWNRIRSDSLANGTSYSGDVGVAFEWDLGTLHPGEERVIPVIIAAGSSLEELKSEVAEGLNFLAPKPYIEWVKVVPETPEMLEEYTILASVRNPSDKPVTVTLWCNETGLLVEYDDQLLIPPANKSQTLTIPPHSNVTFSFKYKHYWRWLKPFEIITGSDINTVKEILKLVPNEKIPEIIRSSLKIWEIVEYATLTGAKPTITYHYNLRSNEVLNSQNISTRVVVPLVKIDSLIYSIGIGVISGTFTGVGLSGIFAPEPTTTAIGGILLIGEGLTSLLVKEGIKIATDPDSDYTQPVVLEPITIPELDEYPDNPVKDMVKQYTLLASEAKAFSEAWAKYLGAKMVKDTEWERRQLVSAYYYLNLLVNDYAVLKEKAEVAIDYLQSMGLNITEEDVSYVKKNITENGLPEIEVELLKKFGLSNEEINAAKDIVLMLPNETIINYNETILGGMEVQQTVLGWIANNLTTEINEVGFVNATVDVDPDTINLKSKGKWITAYIEIPGYDVSKINISTVYLNGIIPAINDPKYGFVRNPEIKDRDGNGYPELMVKFDRQEVKRVLRGGNVTLFVIGEIDDKFFVGNGEIRVMLGCC